MSLISIPVHRSRWGSRYALPILSGVLFVGSVGLLAASRIQPAPQGPGLVDYPLHQLMEVALDEGRPMAERRRALSMAGHTAARVATLLEDNPPTDPKFAEQAIATVRGVVRESTRVEDKLWETYRQLCAERGLRPLARPNKR